MPFVTDISNGFSIEFFEFCSILNIEVIEEARISFYNRVLLDLVLQSLFLKIKTLSLLLYDILLLIKNFKNISKN